MNKLIISIIIFLIIPQAKAEIEEKIHKLCLKASDYSGCVETLSSEQSKSTNKIPLKKNKASLKYGEEYEKFATYQVEQAVTAFELSLARCKIDGGKLSKKADKDLKDKLKRMEIPITYMENKSVKKGVNYFLEKYNSNCSEIGLRTIDEAIYVIHGENLGNKMSTVNKADLLKPTCDARSLPKNLKESVITLACLSCHMSYDLNMEGKKSYLSKEKSDNSYHLKSWDKITKNLSDKRFTSKDFLRKQREVARTKFCPTLY